MNTFTKPDSATASRTRSSWPARPKRSSSQLRRLADFQARNASDAGAALRRLQEVATSGGNVFDELMRAARGVPLGQITEAFFEVGGQYRRNV